MAEPIEDAYFGWLCAKVRKARSPIYDDLFRILHGREFVWRVAGDRNRVDDGRELRDHFLREKRLRKEGPWYSEPCSILEMMVAFSERAYFQTERKAKDWFWDFVANLMLDDFRHVTQADVPYIEDILHAFVWRTYEPSGHGGMFPLRWPKRDQREVEIWYQFCDYLEDQGMYI